MFFTSFVMAEMALFLAITSSSRLEKHRDVPHARLPLFSNENIPHSFLADVPMDRPAGDEEGKVDRTSVWNRGSHTKAGRQREQETPTTEARLKKETEITKVEGVILNAPIGKSGEKFFHSNSLEEYETSSLIDVTVEKTNSYERETRGLRRLMSKKLPRSSLSFISQVEENVKKPGCSLAVDGAECFTSERSQALYRSFEKRLHWVMILYAAILFVLGAAVNTIIKLLTFKIAASRDRFIREFMEAVFRTFTIVSIVMVVVETLLQVDVFELGLEELIFGNFEEEFDIFHIESRHVLQNAKVLERVQFFLAGYLAFVLLMTTVGWHFSRWLERVDSLPVDKIIAMGPNDEEATYAYLRYEFVEAVSGMAVPGLDPEFYNFMEYFRSCLLQAMTQHVSLRNSVMVFGLLVIPAIHPVSHYRHLKMVLVSIAALSLPLLLFLFIGWRIIAIKRLLSPRMKIEYVAMCRQVLATGIPADPEDVKLFGPLYKQLATSDKTICCNWWIQTFYRTRSPNKHESLFWLWRGGPAALNLVYDAAVFIGLCTFGQVMFNINEQWPSWWGNEGHWPFLVFWIILLIFMFLAPFILWHSVIVTSTCGMINYKLLDEVWESRRAQTIQRVAHLIDALRVQGTLYEIGQAGEAFFTQLEEKVMTTTPEVKEQNERIWNDLDDNRDGLITEAELYTFLRRQGLNLKREAECQVWISTFGKTPKKRVLTKTDFMMVISVVKQLLGQPLDIGLIRTLLFFKYEIDPDDTEGINLKSLKTILRQLHLSEDWTSNQIVHCIQLVSQSRLQRSLSLDEFVNGLKRLEAETLGTLGHAVGQLKGKRAT